MQYLEPLGSSTNNVFQNFNAMLNVVLECPEGYDVIEEDVSFLLCFPVLLAETNCLSRFTRIRSSLTKCNFQVFYAVNKMSQKLFFEIFLRQ